MTRRDETQPRRVPGLRLDLMRDMVEEILLVSSPYDSYLLEQGGALNERLLGDYIALGLRHIPSITQVATGQAALDRLEKDRRIDLIVTVPHPGGMDAATLAEKVRATGRNIPIALLAFEHRELSEYLAKRDVSAIDRAFLWQGDTRILLAIVKSMEDRQNAPRDCAEWGVPVLLLIEDSIAYYSSFLPLIYTELVKHCQALNAEGVNAAHRILRMRARPKILLATSFEEAIGYFNEYGDNVLGILSDVEFPWMGAPSPDAGAELARTVRSAAPDVPIVLHSSNPGNERIAKQVGAPFLLKNSPTLLADLRRVLLEDFSFGDFVFRLPDRREVGRARDLRTLEEQLATVPIESIAYHGERNHFSKWLRARTEFALALRLRPRRISDYPHPEAIREDLIQSLVDYRREQRRGVVSDFNRNSSDEDDAFERLGGGSLGGKARGLAFVRRLLTDMEFEAEWPGIQVGVPPCVVLGTDVFDAFLKQDGLAEIAVRSTDDREILQRFLGAGFPAGIQRDLLAFVKRVRHPIAVRSSSRLEDSQYQPFSGVYRTHLLPNSHPDHRVRLSQLLHAIKSVYASTFSSHAKAYLKATPFRLEEEKMAVIIQRVVGSIHGDRCYPHFAGVARSYNFYPTPPLQAGDGIAAVALGLGRTVVEGGRALRFCPRYPQHIVQFSTVEDILENSQRQFWALLLDEGNANTDPDGREILLDLDAAEEDGTLAAVGSTYSHENAAIYDGIARAGTRLVSFAPVLKHGRFPLAQILARLLEAGTEGVGGPVEIEFAVDLGRSPDATPEFGLLQMRRLAPTRELDELELQDFPRERILCHSESVLGHGRIEGIEDIVAVDFLTFDRGRTRQAAAEIASFNASLVAERRPYLLIGVGRWGASDPWLGIPVSWDQICGARVVVEAGFRDFAVTPSQGTHFFQNLTSFEVGYFTVNPDHSGDFVDWEWLARAKARSEGARVRHIRLDRPLTVIMNGRRREGAILKPP